ncbi:hypothetical protein EJ08DRAFT_620730 [Tothia fuscella]|uniref:Uncharacterized protein n=1 Tax=Tothia fuscella TaxID=1048955 RepID=A0A9P4TTR8_9PEZI|nr:hypothetical protein EJ08DRAFT_620730 [Tothia fuscella]
MRGVLTNHLSPTHHQAIMYSPINRNGTKPYSELSPKSTFQQGPLRCIRSRWWIWELFGMITCVICLLAICITLRVFDGKPLPSIPFSISLNTIASLLGTAIKTTLLLVVTSAISQLKWLWFHRTDRELQDLQVFDEASRGPWGAMVLLKTSGISLASLGALIVLLLLAFDPFVQQLIATPQRQIASTANSTVVKRALAFNLSNQYDLAEGRGTGSAFLRMSGDIPLSQMRTAVANGANSGILVPELNPSCPTSTCNWPGFTSLGLCSKCRNVTDFAKDNWKCQQKDDMHRTCNYNLPNSAFNYTYFGVVTNNSKGWDIEIADEVRQRTWTTTITKTDADQNVFLVVSTIAMVENNLLIPGGEREQVREAHECSLSMCVVEHELAVDHGVTNHTRKTTEQPFVTRVVTSNNVTGSTAYEVEPATVRGVKYSIDGASTLRGLQQAITLAFEGNVTVQTINSSIAGSQPSIDGNVVPTNDLNQFFYIGFNFTQSIDNVANSVSRYMRSLSNETTVGQSIATETYIHVRWPWIAFPVVLVFAGLVLLALAAWETRRRGIEVWKYSCLPLLFHGVQRRSSSQEDFSSNPMDTIEEMEEEANRIRVKLGRGSSGGAWMLRQDERGYDLDLR